jgi:Domain of unknown function (DUF5666)
MSTAAAGDVRTANRSGKPDLDRESMIGAILALKMNGSNPATIVFQQRRFSMNKTALAIIMCSIFALPASAATILGGKITSVDAGGTSFNYAKKKKNWRFRITDKTVIRVGQKTGNLSDLKTGQSVKVEFQRQGNAFAALIIGIGF